MFLQINLSFALIFCAAGSGISYNGSSIYGVATEGAMSRRERRKPKRICYVIGSREFSFFKGIQSLSPTMDSLEPDMCTVLLMKNKMVYSLVREILVQ